jgi:hypothetical protein
LKEYTEKIIEITEVEDTADAIYKCAQNMFQLGWYFRYSEVDSLLEKAYLFFERDVDVS